MVPDISDHIEELEFLLSLKNERVSIFRSWAKVDGVESTMGRRVWRERADWGSERTRKEQHREQPPSSGSALY
jgi:hypothetical protein